MPSKPNKPKSAPMRLSVGAAAPVSKPVGLVARVVEAVKGDGPDEIVAAGGELAPGTYDRFPLEKIDLKDKTYATRQDEINEGNTEDLAQVLQDAGQINPIEVLQKAGGMFVIVDGFRRSFTLREILGRRHGKVTVLPAKLTAEEAFDRAVAENAGRLDNSVADRVHILRRYVEEREISLRKAASKMGISPAQADILNKLMTQPEVLKAAVKAGLGLNKAGLLAKAVLDGTIEVAQVDAEAKVLASESRAVFIAKQDERKERKAAPTAGAHKKPKALDWTWSESGKLKGKVSFDPSKDDLKSLRTLVAKMLTEAKNHVQKAKAK